MASEPPQPDPQLESILLVLQQLLVQSVAKPGSAANPLPIPDEGVAESKQLNDILQELKKLYDAQTAVTATEIKEPKAEKGPRLAESLGQLVAVVAGVMAALLAVVVIAERFVGAIDPGLIEQFHRTIRDLQATIGVAFVGIFEQGMNFIRALAAAVQPVFVALKPVVDQLVGVVLKGLSATLSTLTPILLAVIPVLKVFADIISLLSAVTRPLTAVLALFLQIIASTIGVLFTALAAVLDPLVKILDAFMDGFQDLVGAFSLILRVLVDQLNAFISGLFGTSFQDIVKQVTNAFVELTKMIIVTAARLALMAGDTNFVRRMRDALNNTGQAAVGSTSMKSLEQIGKDMAMASVNAAGVASAKDATNADIVKTLDEMLKQNKTNTEIIVGALERLPDPGGAVYDQVEKVALDPVGYTRNLFDALNPF